MKKILALAMVFIMSISLVGYAADQYIRNETVNINLSPDDLSVDVLIGYSDDNYVSSVEYTGADYSKNNYDLKAEVGMEAVNEKLSALVKENIDEAETADVTGEFSIEIKIPTGLKINENFYDTAEFEIVDYDLEDANVASSFADIYVMPLKEEVTVSNNTIKFVVKLKSGLKGTDLFVYDDVNDVVNSKLGDSVILKCTDVISPKAYGLHTIVSTVKGYTEIEKSDDAAVYKVNYEFGNVPKVTLNIKKPASSGGSGGGGSSKPSGIIPIDPDNHGTPDVPSDMHEVEFVLGSGVESEFKTMTVKPGEVITLPEIPGEREGYVFSGWSANGKAVSGEIVVNEDMVIAANWINTKPVEDLNSENHIVYIQGYPDGSVQPDGNITRSEVATIFYRLLKEEKLAEIKKEDCEFNDVSDEHWAKIAIATLQNGGYINGYEDGSFGPDNTITRAEFVAIASRFAGISKAEKSAFSDIDGHWAEEYIKHVADLAWIGGYEDGSFRPNATITRAEVVKIINRMLVRFADADSFVDTLVMFHDNNKGDWYYYDILEAANNHGHQRRENGYSEDWTSVDEITGFEF